MSTQQRIKNQIEIEPIDEADETKCTFVIHDEDHTLGNALRYIINKNPKVQLCTYGIPHPAERKINFRIQTREGSSATEVLKEGLQNLHDACQVVLTKFDSEVEAFKENQDKNKKQET